ncbi:hypothetical protein UFOVP242_17 [uncultured Caudovirales phage]|uniref:Uncharacterized protein n=1 Tax=uncultured Caudovirales phage TaxID=2100421 RepID=A0A6J7X308_9CAUD|nr:hypothetical protein UFOVP242_17 [uncultured Caudovirales phage]
MKLLVGETGLVGTSLKEQNEFDHLFKSSNIEDLKRIAKDGDEIYLACLPATKWLVNQHLERDIETVYRIIDHLKGINYSQINLISTIDVYSESPLGVDETYEPISTKPSYGANRYLFECLVREKLTYDRLSIFRLPALFNKHIKKNIVYDMLKNHNVEKINANSFFQWYNLDHLFEHITFFNRHYHDEQIFNLFPEPLDTREVIKLFPDVHQCDWGPKVVYDYKTKFSTTGYFYLKETSLSYLKEFINEACSN